MLSNGKEKKLIYFWSALRKRFWTLLALPQQRKEPMDTSTAPAPQRGLCAGAGRGHRLSVPVPGLSGAFPKGTMILVGLMGLGRIFFFF